MTSKEAELGQVAELVMGTSPKGDTYNSEGRGVPLLNGPTEFGLSHPACSLFTTDPKRMAEQGDLLFCVRGSTTGRMNWADRPYAIGRGIAAIRGATPLETRFIRHSLEGRLSALLQRAGGGTFPNLRQEDIATFRIPFPNEREDIGSILAAYDELIDNSQRRVDILQLMAQAIYREWFVNLLFPGHDGVELVSSKVGPIPEEWSVVELARAADNLDRFRKPLSQMQRSEMQGDIPYYGAAKIIDYVNDFIFDGEYLLLAEDGTVITDTGFPVLQLVNGKFWPNNHTHILRGTSLPTRFLFLALMNYPIAGHITGAAQPKITQANMNRIALLQPSDDYVQDFMSRVDPMIDLIQALVKQIENLREARDLLLPKLISGEINVSELDIDTSWFAA